MIDFVLVGRDAQFARLADLLAADTPAVVVGEAGIGKTTLLRAVAAASGRRVFEGGALSTLSWLEYLALERATGRRLPGDPTVVAAAVEAAVGDGVLLLDDLQWAAPPSLDTVELLAGRVGLVAGVRRGDSGADPALDRLAGAGFETVELAGLRESDARSLLEQLRPELGAAGVARLIGRTGGNPLLLRELAATGEPSKSLRLALAARLRKLDEAGREAFGLLALAGRSVSVEGLGAAGAKSLLAAGLAHESPEGRIEITHTLLGEVALDQLDDAEHRRLHAIVARSVADSGEAARHHALAGEPAAAYLAAMRAAGDAERSGERASHLAVAASCADGPEADALRVEAAQALEEAHDWPALSGLLEQLRRGPPEVRASAALLRARAAWHAGDTEGLRQALEDGLQLVGGTGSDVEVRLRIEASRIPIFIDSDADEGLRTAAAALELARTTGVDVPRAEYLYGTALYAAQQPGAAESLQHATETARATGDVGTEMLAANNLVAHHESMGDPAVARGIAGDYVRRARELGLGVWERSFLSAVSNLDFHAGNYPAVLDTSDQLLDLPLEARTLEATVERQCLALIDIGRIDEAERRIAALPERPDDWTLYRQVAWVRTEAALWGGRPTQALELAQNLLTGPEGDLNIAFAHVSRAWALFDLERDPGPPVTASYPAMLSPVPDEVRGICLMHAGEDAAAIEAFEQAAEGWAPYHRRGELRCLWGAGEAARRRAAADAVERLLNAEKRAQRHGMLPLLARVRRSLRAAGLRRSAPRSRRDVRLLTDRERDVLHLVGDGLTNAEIAGRLGVSRHTVVSQITSASAKLGASSRSHAASLVDRLAAV
ncbi:MAG TPA: LuxR C-terminal-related transcriptional regulator [Jatrophihabitans sp.]|nr:LuxR C-terminal-related transcriptional regulator [Jatrophihabitans sp.]